MSKYTFRDLKESVNKLTEEQLDFSAIVLREESSINVAGLDLTDADQYYNEDDPDDRGSIEQLEDYHGSIDMSKYKLAAPKGRPFLWEEF